MFFLAVSRTVPLVLFRQLIGFAIAVDFIDVISMRVVASLVNPTFDESVTEFMFSTDCPVMCVIPITQQQFSEMSRQTGDVAIVPPRLPAPSIN